MRVTAPALFCSIALVLGIVSGTAAANVIGIRAGEVLRLTFTAPFPDICISPSSFPGAPPPYVCDAISVSQPFNDRVTRLAFGDR